MLVVTSSEMFTWVLFENLFRAVVSFWIVFGIIYPLIFKVKVLLTILSLSAANWVWKAKESIIALNWNL